MLIKCKYCKERIRPIRAALHEKRCVYARRALKSRLIAEAQAEPVEVPVEPVVPIKEKKARKKKDEKIT